MASLLSRGWRVAAVVLLPLSEYYLLRRLLHDWVGIRIGWRFMVDADLLLPGIVGLGLWISLLSRHAPLKLRPQKWIAINLLLLLAVVAYSAGMMNASQEYSLRALSVWWVIVLLALGSSLFLLLPPSFYWKNPSRLYLFPCLVVALSVVFQNVVVQSIWSGVAPALASGVCRMITFWGSSVSCSFEPSQKLLLLTHPLISIGIGHGCAGGEAILLFAIFYSLVAVRFWDSFSPAFWCINAVTGTMVMVFLNFIRIAAFYLLGLTLSKTLGNRDATNLILSLFHLHSGWVFYLSALAAIAWLFRNGTQLARFRISLPQQSEAK